MVKSFLVRASRIEFTNYYDFSTKRDLYCVLWIGSSKANTRILEGAGKYPHWDQQFQVDLTGISQTIRVEVFESKGRVDNVLLGKGSVTTSTLHQTQSGAWISLMHKDKQVGIFVLGCQPMSDPILEPVSTDMIRPLPTSPKSSGSDNFSQAIELQVRGSQKDTVTGFSTLREKQSPTKLKQIRRLIQDLCSSSFSGVSGLLGKSKPMKPLPIEKHSLIQSNTRQELLNIKRPDLKLTDQANKSSSEDNAPELIIPID